MLKKILFAAAFLCLPVLAAAQVDDGGDAVSQGAKAFVDQFWSEWSGPNATALPYIRSAVSDPINFYGQSISRAAFIKAELAFMNRWPDRHYAVQGNSESVSCYPDELRCEVNGIVAWNDDSPDRGVASKGTTAFDFILDYQSVNSKVIYHLSKETGTDTITSFGAITTGVVTSPALQLPDSTIQHLGCFDDELKEEVHYNCTLVGGLDLTAAYHTAARWQLAITQGPDNEETMKFTFLKDGSAVPVISNPSKVLSVYFSTQPRSDCSNTLWGVNLVYLKSDTPWPIIVANSACFTGGPNQPEVIKIWTYNHSKKDFEIILGSVMQCNETARLFTSGLLAGYYVSDTNPAEFSSDAHARQSQLINVYRFGPDQAFHKVLSFNDKALPAVSCSMQDNPYDIIDHELPKIFARLGLSHH